MFCVFLLCLLRVFILFLTCVPANQESPKLVEMICNKPNSYVWYSSVYVGAGPLYVGLLGLVGPLCKCDAGLDILCTCVASFVHFCRISRMGSCNPRITKTHRNG